MASSAETRPREFPRSGSEDEQLRFLLAYAVRAPSSHNSQPWLFRIGDGGVDLFADRRRALPVVDPEDRALTISCGAALDHLAVAARRFGREPVYELLPEEAEDEDHLAVFWLGEDTEPAEEDIGLFEAIAERRTTRHAFDGRLVPESLRDRCRAIAAHHGVELALIHEEARKAEIADLVAEGDRRQFADADFRKELARWVHSRRAESHDGMSGDGFGFPDVLSPVGALVIRTFDLGNGVAAGDASKIMDGSPLLAVISTPGDQAIDWLRAGCALSHILLTITAAGATSAYLNQPVEVPALRPLLQDVIDTESVPQLVLRVGYGPSAKPSPRRPLHEVLI